MRRALVLGELQVLADVPAKALKALAVIADGLHRAYDELPDAHKLGHSKDCCVFSSLATREFLVGVGFEDAEVRLCSFLARVVWDGEPTRTLMIGDENGDEVPWRFNGHAVVVVPSAKLLLDVSLFQAIRPHWDGALTGMMAVPFDGDGKRLAGVSLPLRVGARFDAVWVDRPDLKLRSHPDYVDQRSRGRRRRIARALIERFGDWREARADV